MSNYIFSANFLLNISINLDIIAKSAIFYYKIDISSKKNENLNLNQALNLFGIGKNSTADVKE